MCIGRTPRLRLPRRFHTPAMCLGFFAVTTGMLFAPATAQGPPGAAAAAAGAAAAATASAPAPPPKKTAAAAAMDAAAMGNSALAPAKTDDSAAAAPAEIAAASGAPPVAANAAPAAIAPDVAADIVAGPLPKDVGLQCTNLLKLATLLKADVAKTTKDVLSISVVRDAGQIEEMAKKMREAQH